MSDSTPLLPARPSLEQLRKQAKELLQAIRAGDPSAKHRLRTLKPELFEPILADAQYVLAREHGFESWPKLVHYIQTSQPPDLQQHHQIAEDLVAVYNSDDIKAAARLNDLFHSSLDIQQIRDFIRDKLFNLPDTAERINNFTVADAQLVLAQLYGFRTWQEFVQSSNASPSDARSAPVVLSSRPPLYRIEWANNSIEPRQPMSTKDWEDLSGIIKELGITTVKSGNMIGDDDLQIISQLDQITSLNLGGSKRITDAGLQHLAKMPQLCELN